MNIEFSAEIWYWRGPSPYYFVTVPMEQGAELKAISNIVTYGWGMIPAEVRIGKTTWTTALFAKNGSYVVPLKAVVRKAEKLDEGDVVTVQLKVG